MNRLAPIIIVPYRNRPEHLAEFLNHMQIGVHSTIPICIVEQTEHQAFNRGKLLNIGYLCNPGFTHYIFHDVDMLPYGVVNYMAKYTAPVVQLVSSNIQLLGYLGGVTRFSGFTFNRAGGYHNDYYHRAEDNEMAFNLKRLDINVINRFSKFKTLDHKRIGPEFDPALWHKAQLKRHVQNQLSCCEYGIKNEHCFENVKHLLVSL